MKRFLSTVALLLLVSALASSARAQDPNSLTPEEKQAGWRLLFDGQTITGWRGYKATTMPASWRVENGSLLACRTQGESFGDIITVEQFADFELVGEWKMTAGNNSGVIWPQRWPNYRQYEPVLDAARKAKAPVVALNAKAETIRQVARSGGIARVPPKARQELPAEMLLQDPLYEKLLALQLMVHASATPERLRPMIEAQIARDESMAQALAAFAKSKAGKQRKFVVLCGAGHVSHGQGIPTRVRQRLPNIRDRIVLISESGEVRLSPEELAQAREIEVTHEQWREIRQPVADYLCVKPLASEPGPPSPESGEK